MFDPKSAAAQVDSRPSVRYLPWEKLICVTNRKLARHPFGEQVRFVCAHRPRALVLREKDLEEEAYQKLAEEVKRICEEYAVPLILHTHVGAAQNMGISCVHLPLASLRNYAAGKYEGKRGDSGSRAAGVKQEQTLVIGCSVHSAAEAIEAESLGASYLFAGHVYATACKKDIPERGLVFLKEVCASVKIPVYGLGGIDLREDRIHEVLAQGAAGAAVMSGMMQLL